MRIMTFAEDYCGSNQIGYVMSYDPVLVSYYKVTYPSFEFWAKFEGYEIMNKSNDLKDLVMIEALMK